ncbi:MAG: DUF1131 family protein [Elusimicrobia bacterium]|nr:DUF1131 family protein [Elusimicrobiota bacterium]
MDTRSLRFIGCVAVGVFLFTGAGPADKTPKSTPQEKPELAVSAEGVGPLNAKTPFDAALIQEVLPGYVVTNDTSSTEGLQSPVIKVLDRQKEILVITPADRKTIFSIRVKSGDVANALGPELGSAYSEIYKRGAAPHCSAGKEEESGLVVCPAPSAPNVLYVFESTEPSDIPDGKLPPQKALRTWSLIEIVWKPARSKKSDQ